MNVYPSSLILKNFQSYENEKFVFSKKKSSCKFLIKGENLDDENSTSNGSGKSGIPDAILYIFTGETFKGKKYNDVIREGEDSCYLRFNFFLNKKKGYISVRRNPNEINFYIEGISVLKENSFPDRQKELLKWFGFDYELLTKFILIGESDKYRFSFLNSSDVEKKKLLTKLTNSTGIDLALEDIKSEHSEVSGKIKEYSIRIEDNNILLKNLKEDIAERKEQITKVLNSKKNKKRISLYKRNIFKYKEKLKKVKKDIDIIEKRIISFEDKYEDKISSLEKNTDDLREKLRTCEKNILLLKTKLSGIIVCPNCNHIINKHNLDIVSIEEEIKIKNDKKNLYEKNISQNEEQLKILKKYKNKKYFIELKKKKNYLDDVESSKEFLIREEENKLNLLQTKDSEKLKILKEEKLKIFSKINDVKKVISNYETKTKLQERRLSLLKKYLYHFGKEGFKNYLFSKKLKLIEYTVNDVLKRSNIKFVVEINGMKKLKSGKYNKKIDTFIYNINGKKRYYKDLSKGEARRIDLAFIIAFGELLENKYNLFFRIADEPFGGLDDKGKKNIINMFDNLGYPFYIISPEQDIEKHFNDEEIITIEKENDISTIKYSGGYN